MPNARPMKHNGETLFAITGDGEPVTSDQAGAEALVELRQMLAAAGASAEVLQILDRPGAPEEILQQLVDAGALPSAEDTLAGVIHYFEPLLEPDTDPLQAELAGSQFLGVIGRSGTTDEELPELLRALAGQAEGYGSPAALAMLRVLAVVGPPQVRAEARAAADRLAVAGLADPAWAKDLGQPKPGGCFGYTDRFGQQETLAITFRYRRQRHALCVLIDHDLGGGVKDCWPTHQVEEIRTQYEAFADPDLMEFREYEPAEAHEILAEALHREPCPEQPDQVEDVRDYLALLRHRVELLAGAAAAPAPPRGRRRAVTVHRLRIGLRGAKPPIWRRLEVPSRCTLDELHCTIQEAFEWHGCHLWSFETLRGEFGMPDPELGHRSAASIRLAQVAAGAGDRIRYTYDFGDDWVHDIQVEEVLAAEPGVAYPRCLAGRRASPPEDCGGVRGYQELLEVLGDPGHPEHHDQLTWLGLESPGELDPATFDLASLNKQLSARVLVRA